MKQLFTEEKLMAEYLGLKDPTPIELEAAIRARKREKRPKFEAEARKRYRLHKKVKAYCFIYPKQRMLVVDDPLLSDVPADAKKAIACLQTEYKYNIQTQIPN